MHAAREAGVVNYIVKPFRDAELLPAIEIAMARYAEFQEMDKQIDNLKETLETRKLVERAKGLLQAKQGMTEPEAFKWIQRAAMDRRTTMRRVAEVVLETLDAADDAAPAYEPFMAVSPPLVPGDAPEQRRGTTLSVPKQQPMATKAATITPSRLAQPEPSPTFSAR